MFMSFNKRKWITIGLFALYCVGILFMFFHHENWRDEAQSYLLCRDMNLWQIFQNAHYEGHPIFYYLLLYPFVKLGVGPSIVNIFSAFFMILSMYLLLFKIPGRDWIKFCILFSYPVLYEFSVVGRSYSLIFFLLTLYVWIFPYRKEKPILLAVILGLLLNTHLLMFGFVGFHVFGFYFYEIYFSKNDSSVRKKMYQALAVLGFFGILFYGQFYPVLVPNDGLRMNTEFSLSNFVIFFFSFLAGQTCNYSFLSVFVTFGILVFVLFWMFRSNRFVFWMFLCSSFFMAFLLDFVLGGASIYSSALVYSLFLFCVFLLSSDITKPFLIGLSILSICSCFTVYKAYSFDYLYPYSNGIETAKYIQKEVEGHAIILCNCDHMCSSLIPYTSNRFYHPNSKEFFTYIVWKAKRDDMPVMREIGEFVDSHDLVYYVYTNYNWEDNLIVDYLDQNYQLDLVYSSSLKSYSFEDYRIYKIGEKKEF